MLASIRCALLVRQVCYIRLLWTACLMGTARCSCFCALGMCIAIVASAWCVMRSLRKLTLRIMWCLSPFTIVSTPHVMFNCWLENCTFDMSMAQARCWFCIAICMFCCLSLCWKVLKLWSVTYVRLTSVCSWLPVPLFSVSVHSRVRLGDISLFSVGLTIPRLPLLYSWLSIRS